MPIRPLKPLRIAIAIATRAYRASPPARQPYKDAQARDSLKPRSAEQLKSGRDDDAAAAAPKTAFRKGGNSPEEARDAASDEEGGGDPLEVSGANQELSKPQGDEGGKNHGAGKEVRKGGRSGGSRLNRRGS